MAYNKLTTNAINSQYSQYSQSGTQIMGNTYGVNTGYIYAYGSYNPVSFEVYLKRSIVQLVLGIKPVRSELETLQIRQSQLQSQSQITFKGNPGNYYIKNN